jgi:predicted DNA binding CopG/RHH family protein
MKKKPPRLSSNKAAEDFVATADLTRYDLSKMVPVRFELKPKTERVNMRLSKELLDSVKEARGENGRLLPAFYSPHSERAVAKG